MNDSQLQLENYKDRRRDVIVTSLFMLFLITLIVVLIRFSPTFYDMIHESFGSDGTTMMMLIFPYMALGSAFFIRLIMELFDHNYTFRSFWSARKVVKARGLI